MHALKWHGRRRRGAIIVSCHAYKHDLINPPGTKRASQVNGTLDINGIYNQLTVSAAPRYQW
jgi:hypothetical protein